MHPSIAASPVTGSVRTLLRVEGLAVLVVAVLLYADSGAGWGRFAALFLLPDIAFAAYLLGPRVGALAYNATHGYVGPLALATLALLGAAPSALLPIAFIWVGHIGMDRALGYGLKYATAFGDTHLGRVGRRAAVSSDASAAPAPVAA